MNNFRTVIDIPGSAYKLSYKTPALFIGSCFTQNIGNMLLRYKFPVDVNPFGVIYNPMSVKKSIEILIDNKNFTTEQLQNANGLWFSYYHHSNFSDIDQADCLEKINTRLTQSALHLKTSGFLFITFGTAWIFLLKQTGEIVSNCHKLPAGNFQKKLLTVEEVVSEYKNLITNLSIHNPCLKIILTVSPIRHLKDGAAENQASKSTLILAVNQLKSLFSNVAYFPAYEIVMDELRDYRFYEEDMVHPNQTAIKYLCEKFLETYLDTSSFQIMAELDKIIQATNHRPFNLHSHEYIKFLQSIHKKAEAFSTKYPFVNIQEEKKFFQSQLV